MWRFMKRLVLFVKLTDDGSEDIWKPVELEAAVYLFSAIPKVLMFLNMNEYFLN